MQRVDANVRSLRELLDGKKYQIDYYQREYRWEQKQVFVLIDDLMQAFLEDYRQDHHRGQVEQYSHYFLGSVLMSNKDDGRYIVDGQQRLTTLTLLLIHLRNIQKDWSDDRSVDIDNLILSIKYGVKSFNLNVPERTPILEALWNEEDFDTEGRSDSVRYIALRFADIGQRFPYGGATLPDTDEDNDPESEESTILDDHAIPYFIDWLIDNVFLVEISALSDSDAYTIFEAMNDRGLSLTPTDMLKGYLLASIDQEDKRKVASDVWKSILFELNDIGKDTDADFFKAWFRSQYADTIRDRKKAAKPRAYDLIGTEFHRWIRDQSEVVGLVGSSDYFSFIHNNMKFFSDVYLKIEKASATLTPGLERIRYNAQMGFTLQNMMLMAPLRPFDSQQVVDQKLRIVSMYIDILLHYRQWNFKAITHSGMQYSAFVTMKAVRDLTDPSALAQFLKKQLDESAFDFNTESNLRLHGQNGRYIKALLARLTDYVEVSTDSPAKFDDFVAERSKNRFEIEHIWADKFERHTDEFQHEADFREYRNRVGGLLILPKSFNASYGALPYDEKLPLYLEQNQLARSLNEQTYQHNSRLRKFKASTSLAFQPHSEFKKADLDARQTLYREIAKQIWNPQCLLNEGKQ